MSGTAGGAVRDAARRFLARHYRVMASAVNVGDWQAYIRVCAAAQEDGTAWFDDEALAELLSVVADTTAGEAESLVGVLVRAGVWPLAVAERAAAALAARSGGAQDDGLRGRCEALAEELERGYVGTGGEWARGADYGLTVAAASLRRALAGPDDARQDGAR